MKVFIFIVLIAIPTGKGFWFPFVAPFSILVTFNWLHRYRGGALSRRQQQRLARSCWPSVRSLRFAVNISVLARVFFPANPTSHFRYSLHCSFTVCPFVLYMCRVVSLLEPGVIYTTLTLVLAATVQSGPSLSIHFHGTPEINDGNIGVALRSAWSTTSPVRSELPLVHCPMFTG